MAPLHQTNRLIVSFECVEQSKKEEVQAAVEKAVEDISKKYGELVICFLPPPPKNAFEAFGVPAVETPPADLTVIGGKYCDKPFEFDDLSRKPKAKENDLSTEPVQTTICNEAIEFDGLFPDGLPSIDFLERDGEGPPVW